MPLRSIGACSTVRDSRVFRGWRLRIVQWPIRDGPRAQVVVSSWLSPESPLRQRRWDLDLLAWAEAVQSGQARKRAETGAEPRASWTGDRCHAGAQDGGPKKQDGVVGRDCQTLPGKSTVPVSAPFAVVGTAFVGKGANHPAEGQFWSAGDARRRG